MIDIKRFLKLNRLTIAIIILILLSLIVPITYSRFQSRGTTNSLVETAFYVLNAGHDTEDIKLSELIPSDIPYVYTFTVANNKNGKRCETPMEYTIKLTTTTNLALSYGLYLNDGEDNIIISDEIVADSDGTYFNYMETEKVKFVHTKDEINTYQLKVIFPEEYNSFDYQGIVEGITIEIDSKQLIDDSK